MADIKIAGFGGQGVLTAGKILIDVIAHMGKNVSWTSSYGAEMRGGPSSCAIVVSDGDIGTPYPSKLDILVAMDERSYDTYCGDVRPGGVIVANSTIIPNKEIPSGVKVFAVDAGNIAHQCENARGTNLVMLGAMMKATKLADEKVFCDGLNRYFDQKGKNSPKNEQCYTEGYMKATEWC